MVNDICDFHIFLKMLKFSFILKNMQINYYYQIDLISKAYALALIIHHFQAVPMIISGAI